MYCFFFNDNFDLEKQRIYLLMFIKKKKKTSLCSQIISNSIVVETTVTGFKMYIKMRLGTNSDKQKHCFFRLPSEKQQNYTVDFFLRKMYKTAQVCLKKNQLSIKKLLPNSQQQPNGNSTSEPKG
jgi:hypothetical protein